MNGWMSTLLGLGKNTVQYRNLMPATGNAQHARSIFQIPLVLDQLEIGTCELQLATGSARPEFLQRRQLCARAAAAARIALPLLSAVVGGRRLCRCPAHGPTCLLLLELHRRIATTTAAAFAFAGDEAENHIWPKIGKIGIETVGALPSHWTVFPCRDCERLIQQWFLLLLLLLLFFAVPCRQQLLILLLFLLNGCFLTVWTGHNCGRHFPKIWTAAVIH